MSRNISIKEALGMATKTLVSNKLRSSNNAGYNYWKRFSYYLVGSAKFSNIG